MNIVVKAEQDPRSSRTLQRGLMVLLVLMPWLFGSVSTATAQVTYEGCRDIRGLPVASVLDRSIRDVAMASLAPDGSPIIRYNPQVLSWFQPQTRLWWYGHECGHHALGHNFGTTHPLAVEQAADCHGIQTLADSGMLSKRDLRVIQADLNQLGRGDWTHLPGPVRAVNLERCLDGSGPPGQRRLCHHRVHSRGDVSPCQHSLLKA